MSKEELLTRSVGNQHFTINLFSNEKTKEGKIVVPDAASPDQPEQLVEQLKVVFAK